MNKTPSSSSENLIGRVVQWGKRCIKIVAVSAGVVTGVLLANESDAQCPTTPDTVQVNEIAELLQTGNYVTEVKVLNGGYPDFQVDDSNHTSWDAVEAEPANSSIDYKTLGNAGTITIRIRTPFDPGVCDEEKDIVVVDEDLPLDFLSFIVVINGDTLEADWKTVNMINVGKTDVQISSDDGEDYTTIARETYNKDHRELLSHQQKVAIDDIMKQLKASGEYKPGQEDYLLRLESTDKDGSVEYSRLVSIHIDQKTGEMTFSIAPNPAPSNSSLHLQLSKDLNPEDIQSIDIYDIMSKKVSHFDKLDDVSTDKLTGGTYLIRMTTKNGKTIVKKLIV